MTLDSECICSATCVFLYYADDSFEGLYEIKRQPEHFLRFYSSDNSSAAGGLAAKAFATAAADSPADPLFLRRRGLLMTVLSLIMLTPDKRIAEAPLFKHLESMGLRESAAEGDGDDDDEEEPGNVIPGWRSILRDEFVRQDYIERTALPPVPGADGGAGTGPGGKVYWYNVGPRARATIGAPHIIEFACATTGRSVPSADGPFRLALGTEGPEIGALFQAVKDGVGARSGADA